jgi:CRISPR-associated endonuclease/helicase Cas3
VGEWVDSGGGNVTPEDFFRQVTGTDPYAYQVRVAAEMIRGANLTVCAPTGAGKTRAVLLPFLFQRAKRRGPRRLIYALPLRTLVESIAVEAQIIAGQVDPAIIVTIQTGARPEDPFFTLGDVIVTTYDQVLSGLLCAPYGLSDRLANINAAAVAGNLVVFDEFHLMTPDEAFLTGAVSLRVFGALCQSIWMTATATDPLRDLLRRELSVREIRLSSEDIQALPSVARVERRIHVDERPLTPDAVLRDRDARVIVLFNSVARAQAFFDTLRAHPRAPTERILLHSRFFRSDRREKEALLRRVFSRQSHGSAILVATQVIEAGVDITCDTLHTEVCPVNALAQRAGRCARFPPREATDGVTQGTVYVHPIDGGRAEPYPPRQVEATWSLLSSLPSASRLTPSLIDAWIEAVHAEDDAQALRVGSATRRDDYLRCITGNVLGCGREGVSHLIRAGDDSVRLVVADTPPSKPGARETIAVRRSHLRRHLRATGVSLVGWTYSPGDVDPWRAISAIEDIERAYAVCLTRRVAAYDATLGLRIGAAGTGESPPAEQPTRPGHAPLREESWVAHARAVALHAIRRVDDETQDASPVLRGKLDANMLRSAARAAAVLHDVGKLQRGWQHWAQAAQRGRDSSWTFRWPLAHTDFDPDDPSDRARERALPVRRPHHAPTSAFVGMDWMVHLLADGGDAGLRTAIGSAALAAVLSHHGGWLHAPLDVQPLVEEAVDAFATVAGRRPDDRRLAVLMAHGDKAGLLQRVLDTTTGADAIQHWWPVVAYLMRTLRLSDQRATAEGSCDG